MCYDGYKTELRWGKMYKMVSGGIALLYLQAYVHIKYKRKNFIRSREIYFLKLSEENGESVGRFEGL